MVTRHNLDCFDEFSARFIRGKVRKLLRLPGFTASEQPDLIQEFARDLIQRSKKFDRGVANWEAFVVVVCENCFATILEHRRADMRSSCREAGSLNRPVNDSEGRRIDIGDTVADSQHELRTGRHRRQHEEASDLARDVAHVLEQLPPQLRKICEGIMRDSKASVARNLGMSQGAFYGQLERIRARFEKASLRDYLN
jgi:RNA polymerase sigma-70 factor (ECF subfamily)